MGELNLDGMDEEMRTYLWHMRRRRMEGGRLPRKEWIEWAAKYVRLLDESPWQRFCHDQVQGAKGIRKILPKD